jgi:hypothetical protein
MKRVGLFLGAAFCTLLASMSASAQTTYTWTQSLNTDFQVAANWGPVPRALPMTNDILVIDGAVLWTLTNVPTQTIGELHITNGALPTMSASVAATLTIAGGAAANDFEITPSSSFLVLSGAAPITISLSAGAIGSVSGFMTVKDGAHRLTAASPSGITFQSGGLFTTGTGFSGNAFGTTSLNSVVFASGSQYVHNAGSNPFGASAPNSVIVFQAGSEAVFRTATGYDASGRTYANLTIDNNTTISGSGGSSFQFQTLTVNSGSMFTHAGSGTAAVTIKGDLTSAGSGNISITSGSGGININGGTTQIFGGGGGSGTITLNAGAAPNPITVGSTTTVNLARDLNAAIGTLTINGTLDQGASFNLTTGAVTIAAGGLLRNLGTGDLTLGGDVSNSGGVIFNGGGALCGDPDSILIRSSVNGTQRLWSASGGTFLFDLTDVDVQDQAGTASILVISGTNTGNNGANWTFQGCPSIARLTSFTAARYDDDRVRLEWQTGFEVDNLGFNIYREQHGKRARVTPQLVAGSALLAGPGVNLKSGRSYSWFDDQASGKDSKYWLEDVSLSGKSTWHGPIAAEAGSHELPPPPSTRSMLLARLGTDGVKPSATAPIRREAKPVEIAAARFSAQSGLAFQPALKLSINREGWYRVTQRELVEAGLDPQVDPRMLQLRVDGREQPMTISGEQDGRLDASDAIEFYGLGVDAAYTDTRAYWLVAGAQPGRRTQLVKGKGSRSAPASFPYTVERKDRTIYFAGLKNGEKENFFGAVVAHGAADQMITLRHLDRSSSSAATVEVALQGVTFVPHRVKIAVNEVEVGEASFASQEEGTGKFFVPAAALREGENAVTLTPLGGESDLCLIDYIRITYPHTYAADDNALRFTLAKKQQVTISGFTSGTVQVLDITDPDEVREVASRVEGSGSEYSVTLSAPKGGRRLLMALADDQASRPASMAIKEPPSNLGDASREADLVIITRREFFESLRPLQTLRESQGLAVSIVDIADIYEEFSYGEKTPKAIKDFLLEARQSWHKPPRVALLVGDASLDPKNYLGQGDFDLVPTKLVDTVYVETASDDWLADFDDDGMADIALGRLPVRTAEEASRVIAKIVSADSTRPEGIALVADSTDSLDFESLTDELRRLIPDGIPVDEIYRGRMDAASAKSQLLASLNRGPKIVNYSGHGNVDQWRGLFTNDDADSLTNRDSLSLFLSITCLNGYFQDVALESLAESLLKAERGGAVAVWASSGLCEVVPQAALNQAMFKILLGGEGTGEPLTLGEATLRAKSAVNDIDVRRTYILFGDPSTRLR